MRIAIACMALVGLAATGCTVGQNITDPGTSSQDQGPDLADGGTQGEVWGDEEPGRAAPDASGPDGLGDDPSESTDGGSERTDERGVGEGADVLPRGGGDEAPVDSDGDGLSDEDEVAAGTDPTDADTDDDGVLDGAEPDWNLDTDGDGLINALDADSDDDGLLDGTELGSSCDDADSDAAICVPDADAGATTTDPLSADTDGGGSPDGEEDIDLDGAPSVGEPDPNDASDDASVGTGGDAPPGGGANDGGGPDGGGGAPVMECIVQLGNPTCESLNLGATLYKLDPVSDGQFAAGESTVSFSGMATAQGAFATTAPVVAVIVKAGPAAMVCTYSAPVGGGSLPEAPTNPANGKVFETSHVALCAP